MSAAAEHIPHLKIRMPQADATLIARAAYLAEQSIHEFVTEAAIDRARKVFRRGSEDLMEYHWQHAPGLPRSGRGKAKRKT